MSMSVDQIRNEALSLPEDQRASLAEELLQSLEPGQAEIDAAWAAEAERRLQRYRLGETTAVPLDDAIDQVRRRLGERRR